MNISVFFFRKQRKIFLLISTKRKQNQIKTLNVAFSILGSSIKSLNLSFRRLNLQKFCSWKCRNNWQFKIIIPLLTSSSDRNVWSTCLHWKNIKIVIDNIEKVCNAKEWRESICIKARGIESASELSFAGFFSKIIGGGWKNLSMKVPGTTLKDV